MSGFRVDFVFAVICEELGVAGAVLVIGMYLAMLWVGLGVVREGKAPQRQALARAVQLQRAHTAMVLQLER